MPPPRGLAAGVGLIGMLMFAIWLLVGIGGPEATLAVSEWGAIAASAFALSCALVAAKGSRGRHRIAWSFVAFGLAGCVVGTVLRATVDLSAGQGMRPVLAPDYFFLLLSVGICLAALFVPTSGGTRVGVRLVLDAVIVTTSLFMLAWAFVLRDLFDSVDVPATSFALAVVYPIADLAMVTIGVMVVVSTRHGYRTSPALVTAGFVAVGVSDAVYVSLSVHDLDSNYLVVFGWAAGMYLIGLGGLASRQMPPPHAEPTRSPSQAPLWLPYLPVPFALGVGASELWPIASTAPILVAGLALVLATLIRQFVLLDQNRRLLVTVAEIALRDPLTGLANRALFTDRLAHAMQLRLRNSAPVSVLLADLDDFKLVNDSLGHPVGDEVLRSVGERIQNSVRPGDTVARLGGDEFAILVEDVPAVANDIADRVIRAFDDPFVVDGRDIYMTLSIGLASAPAVGGADFTAEELFNRADLAMYSAKRAHAAGARTFTPDMRLDATELQLLSQREKSGYGGGVARIQLLGDLRRAIDENTLDLVYQPKFDLTTGSAVGVEALIRWPHPEFGMLEPADFLPLVRENGLMETVTDLVLSRAVKDAASWYSAGIHLPVAINLSAPSLDDETLPDRILTALARHGMPPESLSVEITEDLLLASVVRARSVLDRLRDSGIRVAIDDFGSGYATMTYLRELPIDELKLDRQFVAPILEDERAAAIVRSVLELAEAFRLASVAEGVENRATARRLKEYGCGFAQGHYFSPPVPAKAIRLGVCGSRPVDGRITPIATTRPSWA